MTVKDRQQIEQQQDDSLISPKAKGERLRRIRNMANLSREEFCADGEINLASLISWEVGRFGGLSAKGAARVIARVAKEGVFCTPEWLLYEIGVGPKVSVDYKKGLLPGDNIDLVQADNTIVEELLFFKKLHKNSIDFMIEDDVMYPHYKEGDYVAGIKLYGAKVNSLIGCDCIVQINDGRILMRNLQQGPTSNSYNLIPTNLQTKVGDAVIYNVALISAASIIWHRRQK